MRFLRPVRDESGAQIVEFAVILPLLAVLIIGITDFGQAFAVKQKLTFAARDAARFGSSEPTNDLTQSTPSSVVAIRDLVDADLVAAALNDCSLGTLQAGGQLQWTATGNCPNSGTFTLTIDRGFVAPPVSGATTPTTLISTHVTLNYPFQWHFNSVIRLLAPGATYAGITQIQTDAIAPNQD
jgi:Flp pilus assembly protein TadG